MNGRRIALRLDRVAKQFVVNRGTIEALAPCSFEVYVGEIVAIVGESGAGKSTLLRIAAGLLEPTSGQVIVNPRSWSRAIVFQGYALFPWRTALKNVMFPLEQAGLSKDDRIARARMLLARVGLADRMDAYPNELSGGMCQRVAIARALAMDPTVLLLDEPMAALDVHNAAEVGRLIGELADDDDRTVIMATHDITRAVALADRVLLLCGRPGRIENVFMTEKIPISERVAVEQMIGGIIESYGSPAATGKSL
jgi:NitT/TauT family transport system ATP-binding protein